MKQPTPSVSDAMMLSAAHPPLLKVREMTVLALFSALMIALQVAMASLPNIELVTLLIILCTLHFGYKSIFSVAVFVLVEGLIYGVSMWWINYLYVWPLLVLIVLPLRKQSSVLLWTVLAGMYGLLFGTLCSIPYFITGGFAAGIAYIIAGIPYDLAHCLGNVVSVLVLFAPLDKLMKRCLRN